VNGGFQGSYISCEIIQDRSSVCNCNTESGSQSNNYMDITDALILNGMDADALKQSGAFSSLILSC